jgi:hypothetical protein
VTTITTLYRKAKAEGVDLFIDILHKTDSLNVKVFLGENNYGLVVYIKEIRQTKGKALDDAFNECVRRVKNDRCYTGGPPIGDY